MAEALLRKKLAERKIAGVNVASCGLSARPWGIADRRLSLVIGEAYKLLEDHRSRLLTEQAVREADLILGMENRHVKTILERFPEAQGKADLLTVYAGIDGEVKDYPDSGQADVVNWLRQCYSIMLPCLEVVADRLVR
jgi:protein-tyrosine phosphatase